MNDGDRLTGALDDRGLVGAEETVGGGLGEGVLEDRVAEALGGLRLDDELARNGGGDQSAVSGTLDLLDGVDGGQTDDGRAVFLNGVDGAVNGSRLDQRPDGVVDQHDILGRGRQGGQSIGNRGLAILAAFDDVNLGGQAMLGDLRLDTLDLGGADGNIYSRDALDRGEGAKRVDENRLAGESEKLLRLRPGHAGAEASGGKNREYLHNSWSIAPAGAQNDNDPEYDLRMRTGKNREAQAGLRLDEGLLRPGMRIAVGLSGGADSVALLRLLAARRSELGLRLDAAHLHHGLRGAEADGDLEFCRALAGELDVEFHEKHVNVRAEARGETTEEAARRLRYAWFRELLVGLPLDAVATAHTADDQAETVLAKFLRGAWTEGLSGVHPRLRFPEGEILRPLLGARRGEIEAYLRGLGQSWREDSTNRETEYTRNRIRHELLPELERWNPQIREKLGQMAELARGEEQWWQEELDRLAPQLILTGRAVRGGGRAEGESEAVSLDVTRLRGLETALERRLVRLAAERAGARIDFAATEAIRRLARASGAGQRLELAGGLRVERSPRELRLSLAEDGAAAALPEAVEAEVPGVVDGPAFGVRLRVAGTAEAGEAKKAKLRVWRAGDRVRLRYSSKAHKVKEVLERLHVMGGERAGWPVLEIEGRIVWMKGVEVEPEAGWRVELEG